MWSHRDILGNHDDLPRSQADLLVLHREDQRFLSLEHTVKLHKIMLMGSLIHHFLGGNGRSEGTDMAVDLVHRGTECKRHGILLLAHIEKAELFFRKCTVNKLTKD